MDEYRLIIKKKTHANKTLIWNSLRGKSVLVERMDCFPAFFPIELLYLRSSLSTTMIWLDSIYILSYLQLRLIYGLKLWQLLEQCIWYDLGNPSLKHYCNYHLKRWLVWSYTQYWWQCLHQHYSTIGSNL